jgi:hypothetical protein
MKMPGLAYAAMLIDTRLPGAARVAGMRTAALLALSCAATACADAMLPAAPHPAPATQLAVGGFAPASVVAAPRPFRGFIRCNLGSGSGVTPAAFVVDGRMITHAEFERLHLEPRNIVNIEVWRGPQAVSRFGRGTAGGVVVIATRAAARP